MAWTTIPTVANGSPITAAWANAVRANMALDPINSFVSGDEWDLPVATGANALGLLRPGTNGQCLQGGASLTWAALPASAIPAKYKGPVGIIAIWSGSVGTIPAGWQLCNGTNGTPNLQDRFIVAAGNSYAVGASGGSATHTVPAHTHTFTFPTLGEHAHHTDGNLGTGASMAQPTAGSVMAPAGNHRHFVDYYTSDGSHSHAYSSQTLSAAPVSNMPVYYALCFIQKMS